MKRVIGTVEKIQMEMAYNTVYLLRLLVRSSAEADSIVLRKVCINFPCR
jgi:hypothetical protein